MMKARMRTVEQSPLSLQIVNVAVLAYPPKIENCVQSWVIIVRFRTPNVNPSPLLRLFQIETRAVAGDC